MTRNELTNSNFTLRFWGIIAFCLFVFAASIICVVLSFLRPILLKMFRIIRMN